MFKVYWRTVIRPFKWSILGLASLAGLTSAFSLLSVGVVVPAVATITNQHPNTTLPLIRGITWVANSIGQTVSGPRFILAALIVMILALCVRGLLLVLYQWLTYRVAITAWHCICQRMFHTFLNLKFTEVVKLGRGRISEDIKGPSEAMSNVVAYTSRSVASLVETTVLAAFILYLCWWAGLVFFAIGGLAMLVLRWTILTRVNYYQRESYAIFQRLNGFVIDALDGIKVVKLGNASDRLLKNINRLLEQHRQFGTRYGVVAEIPACSMEVVMLLPLVTIVWLSVNSAKFPLSPAVLVGLVLAFARLKSPAQLVVQAMVELAANLRKVEVIDETLTKLTRDASETTVHTSDLVAVPSVIRQLSWQNVSFSYPDRQNAALENVSFRCRRGEVTAVVGPTGAGKSTLADLLARLYEPQIGAILANDIDIWKTEISEWRRQIGYVGQDCYLFNATLLDNITLWDESVGRDAVENAVCASQLDSLISALPEGYNTVVGDRGVKLSGGQRQRVAIARALIHRPQILIFDEATSALDNLTERDVHAAINSLRENGIILLIAHRLATVREADKIVVLDSGRVLEQGSHHELLKLSGMYRRLYGTPELEQRAGIDW